MAPDAAVVIDRYTGSKGSSTNRGSTAVAAWKVLMALILMQSRSIRSGGGGRFGQSGRDCRESSNHAVVCFLIDLKEEIKGRPFFPVKSYSIKSVAPVWLSLEPGGRRRPERTADVPRLAQDW